MNPNLYTEEYRGFRYLKSHSDAVIAFKNSLSIFNKILPEDYKEQRPIVWDSRLEFFEQLLDLREDSVYVVDPGPCFKQPNRDHTYNFEEARFYEIDRPYLYEGTPLHPHAGIPVTEKDIPDLENPDSGRKFFMTSEKDVLQAYQGISFSGIMFNIESLPIATREWPMYAGMFYDRDQAMLYQKTVTKHLRINIDAISAISKFL